MTLKYNRDDDAKDRNQRQIRHNVFVIILIAAIQAAVTTLGAYIFDALWHMNW